MKLLFAAIACFAALSCSALTPVSLVQLIADGKKFDKSSVQVFGFFDSVAGPRLYLTRDHIGDVMSSIAISLPVRTARDIIACSDRYVYIHGDIAFDDDGRDIHLVNVKKIVDRSSSGICFEDK